MLLLKRLLFLLLLLPLFGIAQKNIRYQQEIFSSADSILDIEYGNAINVNGVSEKLLLNFYLPTSDTVQKRPLMIFIHGGGFQNGSKSGAFPNLMCNGLAKRGYSVATIDYRLGVAKTKSNQDYLESVYRAVQDAKAAVRFFRRYAEKYGIDTAQIFVMGSSAGSKTAMHLAYLQQDEVPASIDVKKMGSIEGNSGNPGYSSKVNGVINCWGAMINYSWINTGDAPMFCVSGTADKTVPYDSSYDYHGFKYGSAILYNRMLQQGVATGLRLFNGVGHTLDNNKAKQDSALKDISAWLFTQLKEHAPEKPDIFKWETDILKLEQQDKSENHSKNAILFIGSSYIRLWEHLPEQIKPYKTINRGFGGSKLNEVAYFIDRILKKQDHLKAIFLYVGNDIVGSKNDKTPMQDLELVKYITERIRFKFPNIPIFWNEISPSEKRWAVWGQIQEANKLIENYCSENENLFYVSSSAAYLGKDGRPITDLFRDDKLHYNDAGYVIWAKIVKAQFNTAFAKIKSRSIEMPRSFIN